MMNSTPSKRLNEKVSNVVVDVVVVVMVMVMAMMMMMHTPCCATYLLLYCLLFYLSKS